MRRSGLGSDGARWSERRRKKKKGRGRAVLGRRGQRKKKENGVVMQGGSSKDGGRTRWLGSRGKRGRDRVFSEYYRRLVRITDGFVRR